MCFLKIERIYKSLRLGDDFGDFRFARKLNACYGSRENIVSYFYSRVDMFSIVFAEYFDYGIRYVCSVSDYVIDFAVLGFCSKLVKRYAAVKFA